MELEYKVDDMIIYSGDYNSRLTFMKEYQVTSTSDRIITILDDMGFYTNLLKDEYLSKAEIRIRTIKKVIE